ncbi:hypothetical protein quinque_006528 [Culex quinquefasciatus]
MSSRSHKACEASSFECIFQRSPSDLMSTSSSGRSSMTRLRPVTTIGIARSATSKAAEPTPRVHTPGHLPRYMTRDRSAATVESRYRAPSRIPAPVSREASGNRKADDSKKTTPTKQITGRVASRTKMPPSEGGLANAVQKVETAELTMKIAELERKCQRQQDKLLEQHELIKLLEQEKEATEKQSVIDLRGLRENDERMISDLRQELAEKCSELIKAEGLRERIEVMKQRLAEEVRGSEEKDGTIFELTEKLANLDEELIKLRQDTQSLEDRVAQLKETKAELQEEICVMAEKLSMLEEELVQLREDKLSLEKRTNESQEELQDEIRCMNRDIEEKNEKIDTLQEEVRKLKFDQVMQEESLKTEKISLKIKSAILQTQVTSFEAMRTATSLQPIEKDHQAEQLIDEIGHNHRRCRSARSKLLEMLHLLKKNTGNTASKSEVLPALFEQQRTEDQKPQDDTASFGALKVQLMSQIRGLFPEEEFDDSEEHVTGRILYDEGDV